MAGTTYQEVVDAVGRYYGVGSDQWVQIAQYGVAAHDAESILSQVPDVDIIKNNAGQVTAYAYNAPSTFNTGGVASEINSNIGAGTQANGNTFRTSIPASGTVNQSGNIDMSSGARSVSTGNTVRTVLGTISTGVAAVSMGCKLGALIDSAIYNAAPDYWDATFPSINPETWNSIAGTNKAGQSFLNALFGTDSQGNTTMYLPKDAAGYLAYCMAQEGFFRTGGTDTATISDTTGLRQSTKDLLPVNCGTNLQYTGIYNSGWSGDEPHPSFEVQSGGADPIYVFCTQENGGSSVTPCLCSKSYFSVTRYTENRSGKYSSNFRSSSSTVNGKPVHIIYFSSDTYTSITPAPIVSQGLIFQTEVAYVILYGTIASGQGKEGVSKQDGATFPDTSSWSSPSATDAALAQQFPDDYQNNAIYTDVPQPDGTTTRIEYIPVPVTATTGQDQNQPVNTEVTYNQTVVNEGISSDELINTIVRYITQTQTETTSDTPNPPDTPNPTDTGTGTTPPVVVPTGQASALFAVYNPSQAQLNSFGAWLWSSNFIDQVLKLFNNPMQAIIGLHKIFASPSISGSANIRVGYLDSGVGSNIVGAQYTTINCGTVKVSEHFGNAFDYTDTQIRLYLPFIGIVDLDTADVMRGSVSVIYHVDVITGACLAEVKVSRDANGGTLYQYAGDAAVRYPISSGSYMGVVSGVLSAVGGVASAVMTGGATLPLVAGAVTSGLSGAHTQVQHSGNFAGNAGAMGAKKPYLIIERPQTAIADGYGAYQGRGSNELATVGTMTGYFKMTDVHLDSVARATESELSEIENLLLKGVIT